MISDAASLGGLGEETVSELLAWRPEHGVLSVYLRLTRASRSPNWPTEVRNGLSDALSAGREGRDNEARQALEATAQTP